MIDYTIKTALHLNSHTTAREAAKSLESKGLLVSRHGEAAETTEYNLTETGQRILQAMDAGILSDNRCLLRLAREASLVKTRSATKALVLKGGSKLTFQVTFSDFGFTDMIVSIRNVTVGTPQATPSQQISWGADSRVVGGTLTTVADTTCDIKVLALGY